MQRILVRIGALGIVVGLGVFAIAQARRTVGDSEAIAAGASQAPKTTAARASARPTVVPTASSRRMSRPMGPADEDDNPLREQVRLTSANEEKPAGPVAQGGPRRLPAQGGAAREEQPGPRGAIDPFASPGQRGAPAAPADQRSAEDPNDAADAPALLIPARPIAGAASAAQGEAQEPGAAAPSAVPALVPVEPAPLRADPFAVPASEAPALASGADDLGQARAATAPADASSGAEGTGQPGNKQLEGPQTPQLTIQKFAPEGVQVGKPAAFRVTVRNIGKIPAGSVEVRDEIPKGTQLMGTSPRASRGVRGELVWSLGTLKPGDESTVEVQLMPLTEGEIGSVATVSLNADASARCVATKPELVLKCTLPKQVLIGEQVNLSIEVSNPGTGMATGVVLEERIPAGMQHPSGNDLEYQVGNLPPGQSRKLELTLIARQPGPLTNILTARGDANLRAEDRQNVEVIAPQLDVAVEGPKRRYLEREATYQFSVRNPGTAPAQQVELVAYLPTGLKFVSASKLGHYEEASRTVHWRLEELPVNEADTVELVTVPVEPGEQKLKLAGSAERGVAVEKEQPVLIEGIAAILFEVADASDPVEIGGETTYEVRVVNQGSKAATNVRLALLLPPEMKALAAEGPTRHVVNASDPRAGGTPVVFDGLARLAPKADTTYRVRVQGLRAGDVRTRVQLMTDDMQTPVTKEESTQIYSDK